MPFAKIMKNIFTLNIFYDNIKVEVNMENNNLLNDA